MIESIPLHYSLTCLISYLVGALPFGLLIARARGVDIRAEGSGNIGATNVFRCVGKSWGLLVYFMDMGKGLFGALLLPLLLSDDPSTLLRVSSGCCAIIGHNWPVYLGFKGGKGIATTSGFLLGLAPAAAGVGLLVWIVTFLTSRYVSLGSILAALSVAVYAWIAYRADGLLLPSVLTALGLLAVLRHRANIIRLAQGTENRFDFKKKSKTEAQDNA